MFLKGKQRIAKHLDVVEIMRTQIIFKVLLELKLSKLERYFLKRNNKFALRPGASINDDVSNSSFDSGRSDEDRIEKVLAIAAKTKDKDISSLAKAVLHTDSKANLRSILKQLPDESERLSLRQ